MTDTTGIKALRVEIAELRLEIAKGYDRFIPETKIHIKLLERILDQLEAERQRADDLVLHVNTQANMREKAEAEIAALKVKDNDAQTAVYWAKIASEALAEIAALKGDQANPVVPVEIMSAGCIMCGKSHPGMQCPMLRVTAVKE